MRFIKYIGSKRKLINHVLEAIGKQDKVLDLFSGSGVVAYHLRKQGSVVHANDIASYSYHINKTYLELDEIPDRFTPILSPEVALEWRPPCISKSFRLDQVAELFDRLNYCTRPSVEYFAKYYSQNPNASKERIFFTRENGLFIDAISEEAFGELSEYRSPILCELIYRMSICANTSGIFKSFHKNIAGREISEGRAKQKHDYAKRQVLARIKLEKPIIPIGPKGKSFQYEAHEFFDKVQDCYDVIYLDPPYNIHQYSGNYHLLEQVCRPISERYIPTDKQIGGIQPDLYKSPFCNQKKCLAEFSNLIEKISCRTKKIVISYNSNGYISKDDMIKLLGNNVSVKEIGYCNFTGGVKRGAPVTEYLFTCYK